ncbi:chitin-binding domain-containing protein [Marinibacterium profundimaris]|nr:chitin-binding domain-containing protein [Marinibacterium profundimaris]
MALKTAIVTLALATLPALASADCSWSHQQAQSCAAGTTWDAETRTCVEQVNS